MKIINLKSISTQKNTDIENMNNINRGITRKLLEKYKPKKIYNIKDIKKMNEQKGVA